MTRNDVTKANYRKTFEFCLIITIITVFGMLHALPKIKSQPVLGDLKKVKITVINEIPQTFQYRKPIPPRQPAVPIPLVGQAFPDNEIIENMEFSESDIAPPPAPKTSIYDEYVYIPHEVPPYPKKGYQYLNQLVVYPEYALNRSIQGQVILGILVDENGYPEKIMIMEDSGKDVGFEISAIRAAQKIEWYPAKQRGRPVKVWIALPIKFELQKESFFGWVQ